MSKLLSANFSRLWKDKVFWINGAFILAISVISMFNNIRVENALTIEAPEHSAALDSYYFNLAPMVGLFIAIFVSLFLGTEYSDGTIRNKIVVGCTRRNIYLANFAVCFAAGLIFSGLWLLGGLVGIPYFGTWIIGAKGFLIFALIAICFTGALTGIFVLISTLSTNKAVTAVVEIVLFLILLIAASYAYSILCEPETISGVIITSNGMEMGEPSANPNYVSGAIRKFYEWIVDFLPTGQGILMANVEISHPVREVVYSVFIAIGTTALGISAFNKKDLK